MNKSKIVLIFILIVVLCFSVGYFYGTNNLDNSLEQGEKLNIRFIVLIFLTNSLIIFLLLLLSPIGLALPLIIKQLFSIGYAAGTSGISPMIYFPISLIHGLFELTALLIVFYISSKNIHIIIKILKKEYLPMHYWRFNRQIIKRAVPLVFSLLLIGSILEVLVSNRLISMILNQA